MLRRLSARRGHVIRRFCGLFPYPANINTACAITVLGRSMVNNVQIAIELGYLDVPEGVLIG